MLGKKICSWQTEHSHLCSVCQVTFSTNCYTTLDNSETFFAKRMELTQNKYQVWSCIQFLNQWMNCLFITLHFCRSNSFSHSTGIRCTYITTHISGVGYSTEQFEYGSLNCNYYQTIYMIVCETGQYIPPVLFLVLVLSPLCMLGKIFTWQISLGKHFTLGKLSTKSVVRENHVKPKTDVPICSMVKWCETKLGFSCYVTICGKSHLANWAQMTVPCLPSDNFLPSIQSGQSGEQNKYRESQRSHVSFSR